MKKNRGTCLYDLNSLNTQKKKRKVFKIIKNSFIGLLICVVQLSFIETAKAQTPNDLISLELHNVSLQSGLDSIGKLSGYKMAYSLDLVSPYRNISLPRQQRSVSATLRLILSKTDLTYSFKGSNILIIKRTSVQNRSNVVDDDTILFLELRYV